MEAKNLTDVRLVELDELRHFVERSFATPYDAWQALGCPRADLCRLFDLTNPHASGCG